MSGKEQETPQTYLAAIDAVKGDQVAMLALVRRLRPRLVRWFERRLGARLRSKTDAEDLAQETFLRVWRKADSYQPGRVRVTTWLHTIAHRLAIDSFRRKRELTEADGPAEGLPELVDGAADPAGQALARQQQVLLDEALSALPERQRAAILLCQVQGFSNAQAAAILDVKVRALESLLARARRALREALSAEAPSVS